ncbi:SusC/RagA family TonB-linked outer membrane protein [Draconibacterium mangrovi]|uniref:SusC/RagA family TonB-linked outer membrane protein n=1 Tax=Draconibacterium mangrovi TaxID=2697469 RepID=UPI0013D711FF|nr:SusC/RagA family TonB-linked outer membrane protein [Draconibacterium mangrovi]
MKEKYINRLLILVTIILIGLNTNAQEEKVPTKEITAILVDSDNVPVADAVVSSFIARDKAVTNEDGSFTINIAAATQEHLTVTESGYKPLTTEIENGELENSSLVLTKENIYSGDKVLNFPYQDMLSNRSVSATTVITGEELKAYPTANFLEALSGRVPGMIVSTGNSMPGYESVGVSIRGVSAVTYIDGILRDATDLAIEEVDKVHIIRDLSGRAMLGISATNPVIYITTKTGKSYKREINAMASFGVSSPESLPHYLDAYDYATLHNEARQNDGLNPLYSQEALNAYQNNSDPVRYPNIDYQDEYLKKQTMYRKANVNFSGGDQKVSYYSMLDYVGTDGLEAVGQDMKYNRYKIRGNVDIKLNDWMKMNVHLSAVYGKNKYANAYDGSDPFDLIGYTATYPSNAHPIMYDDKYIISDNYPVNLTNELVYGGYAENVSLNTQNGADLIIDLGSVLEGLTFKGSAAFDVYNSITNNKGGTEALYRLNFNGDEIATERIVEREVVPSLWSGDNSYMRRTTGNGLVTYDRTFDKHALTVNTSYLQLMEEVRNVNPNYQPLKRQDLSFRANYAYDNKYVAQVDMSYSGSMFLQKNDRFNLYPTVGAGWVISNEDFMADSKALNYLKLYASAGYTGIEYVGLAGFNSYYLFETLWQDVSDWQPGIDGNKGGSVNVYNIMQAGSESFELPTLRFINVGVQSSLFNNSLAVELNYYNRNESDLFSLKQYETPSLYGGYDFLPATNYGENQYWGLDGLVQYTNKVGELEYSIGANATYNRGKVITIDEPVALEEYRKRAGTQIDNIFGYQADGLFQSEAEIAERGISQSWGALQPGDIRYVDYNNDKVVDEKDVHDLGEHTPRIYYGLNLNLKYKGIGVSIIGTGRADGKYTVSNYEMMLSSTANFTEPMMDRWPETNDYPRLSFQSDNSNQMSSFWLRNGAYFTMKNVELSYTLPRRISQKFLMSNLKVFAQGKNLFTLSEYSKYGINPENTLAGSYTYPMMRTIAFGLACKF